MSRPISRAEDRPSGFQPLSAPRSLTQQLFAAAGRRHHQWQAPARLAASDRAGNDRRDRGEPHGGARGGGAFARGRSCPHAPGRRSLRRGECAPPVPDRLRRELLGARGAQCHGVADRNGDRGRGAGRRPRLGGGREKNNRELTRRSMPRSSAAKTPSIRISLSIARSRMRPAIRNSGDFWNISGASSFRGKRSGAAPLRC